MNLQTAGVPVARTNIIMNSLLAVRTFTDTLKINKCWDTALNLSNASVATDIELGILLFEVVCFSLISHQCVEKCFQAFIFSKTIAINEFEIDNKMKRRKQKTDLFSLNRRKGNKIIGLSERT
jgi:hypothetical protein